MAIILRVRVYRSRNAGMVESYETIMPKAALDEAIEDLSFRYFLDQPRRAGRTQLGCKVYELDCYEF